MQDEISFTASPDTSTPNPGFQFLDRTRTPNSFRVDSDTHNREDAIHPTLLARAKSSLEMGWWSVDGFLSNGGIIAGIIALILYVTGTGA